MKKFSNDEWINKFKNSNDDYLEYEILDIYVNSRTRVRVKHLKCGTIYKALPRELMRGNARCRTCYHDKASLATRTEPTIVKNNVMNILGSGYRFVNLEFRNHGHSNNGSYYITVKHLKCGRIFTTRVDHITSDKRYCSCTRKTKSFGELRIKEYLNAKGIVYKSPKIYKELMDKQPLHYDFYLVNQNVLIEYQGRQHYDKEHQISGGLVGWKKQQYHDSLKRKYAKENDIRLIEIPYTIDTQDKINEFLNNNL